MPKIKEYKEIYLAGGCFWGVEKYLNEIPGIIDTEAGYANGDTENPTYKDVCFNDTGHAETVRVKYDSKLVSLNHILNLYFEIINPTSLNRQGFDIGKQYRTGIYFTHSEDEKIIKSAISRLQQNYKKPILIEVLPLDNYYPAEEEHQKYLEKNPGGYCHIGKDSFERARKAIVDPMDYTRPNDDVIRNTLTDLQYRVTMEEATEPPFDNEYWNEFSPGIYVDIVSGEPLFSSKDKFHSSCGWPSFAKTIDPSVINTRKDLSYGMMREEVRSRVGDIHLGHIFNDSPQELGGLRYCINSASIRFIPKDKMEEEGYGKYISLVE